MLEDSFSEHSPQVHTHVPQFQIQLIFLPPQPLQYQVRGYGNDFFLFPVQFSIVMISSTFCRQITDESHGDSASGDFGNASSEDDGRSCIGARETGSKSEGDGESVGDSDIFFINKY